MGKRGLNQTVDVDSSAAAAAAVSKDQVAAVAALLRRLFGGSTLQPVTWDNPRFWNVDASRSDRCQFLAVGNELRLGIRRERGGLSGLNRRRWCLLAFVCVCCGTSAGGRIVGPVAL